MLKPLLKTLSALALTAIFLVACGKQETIRVAGSSTVLPIVSIAAEQFIRQHPELRILVNAGGSGVGINQVAEGAVDIGMASREITREEIAQRSDIELVTVVIAGDAVVPVVSAEVYDHGVQALTLDELGRIYRGEISNWLELGGPDRNILVVDKEKSRGTRHVFMQAILGDEEADAPGADLVLGSNNEEQTAITQSDAAIGMLSQAWLNDDVRGLAIRRQKGSIIDPTLENVRNGSFPIRRDLFLITKGVPQGWTKDFIDFILSGDGQEIVEKAGYVKAR